MTETWPPVECFCYCCPALFLLSKTSLYSLLFSKHYCLVQNKKCHRTILVSNLPSLGTNNLSRKGLIMPGGGLPCWTGTIVETEEPQRCGEWECLPAVSPSAPVVYVRKPPLASLLAASKAGSSRNLPVSRGHHPGTQQQACREQSWPLLAFS